MKILNLYAGIGGNRKLWEEHEITAVELDPKVAAIYQDLYPDDKVIVADAHKYLLEHFKEFDFIWSSPPCPSHSKANRFLHSQGNIRYPDMSLWQEIIFLKEWGVCKWVIENVVSYYDPIYTPVRIDRHYFWSNFHIGSYKVDRNFNAISASGKRGERESAFEEMQKLQKHHGISVEHYEGSGVRQKTFMLRNCVEPELGLFILNEALNISTPIQVGMFATHA